MTGFTEFLHIKWSTSRAADTFGYNRVTLTPTQSDGRYVQVGGGYDMTGSAVADYLSSNFKAQLDKLAEQHTTAASKPDYGFSLHTDGNWYLDGGCGLDCMVRIAKSVGITVTSVYGPMNRLRNRELLGFDVSYSGD